MAIDMFSADSSGLNSSSTASPRISFSHNLDNSIIESYPYRSDSSSDFDFCISSHGFENETSSADELFRDGLIRPNYSEEKRLVVTTCTNNLSSSLSSSSTVAASAAINLSSNQENGKEIILIEGSEQKQHNQSKSFWRINRSSSLHSESTNKKSSFWSSLPLLSRSNSTGSVLKDHLFINKQNPSQKQSKNSSMAIYSTQKPPLKRNYGGAYDYGVRISPVLNVPPPFISKGAANLLGLGSFFRNGKDKKNKK